MERSTVLVTALASLVLFFTFSTPLLFSAELGAIDGTNPVAVFTQSEYLSADTIKITIAAASQEIPLNALYLQFAYIDSLDCESPEVNLVDFPFALEYSTSLDTRMIALAVAQPGDGFTATTTIASLTCKILSPNTESSVVEEPLSMVSDSHAYAADGFATELPLSF